MKEYAGAICGPSEMWTPPCEREKQVPFAIMSIKPVYADMILSGIKEWELRRRTVKNLVGMDILIYATYPYCKIAGSMRFDGYIAGKPDFVLSIVDNDGDEQEYRRYRKYFWGVKTAYAGSIIRSSVRPVDGPTLDGIRDWLDDSQWKPPQSWTFWRGTKGQRDFFFGETGGKK